MCEIEEEAGGKTRDEKEGNERGIEQSVIGQNVIGNIVRVWDISRKRTDACRWDGRRW